jgi:hypothetical protein
VRRKRKAWDAKKGTEEQKMLNCFPFSWSNLSMMHGTTEENKQQKDSKQIMEVKDGT